MAKRNHGDFYATVKYHLFQIFTIILILFAMYKILVVEAPHRDAIKPAPPCVQLKPTPLPKKPRKPEIRQPKG